MKLRRFQVLIEGTIKPLSKTDLAGRDNEEELQEALEGSIVLDPQSGVKIKSADYIVIREGH